MPLSPGTTLGPYEIVAPLGAGGMGEVYRARDARLGRDVAVKVLPQHLSENPEVRARFEREARSISALNHPHICVLHDIGRSGTTDYLVMELVEGETLAQRLAKGPLPLGEVLRLGAQVADALDRAHRAGVVHRDLKPGNVMLTRSGAKLMDFGLARATGAGAGPPHSGTHSPTVAQPLTAEGTLIGTFQYMSPEQLEGREADARADLWALGCVLYEMATGRPAFAGTTQASLISAIMRDMPRPVAELTPVSPPALDHLVGALLAKDPEERVQTAHDARLQLQWMAAGSSTASGAVPAPAGLPVRAAARGGWLPWAVAGLAVAAAAIAVPVAMRRPQPPVIRAVVPPPPNAIYLFSGDNAGPPVISPDGTRLTFVAVDDKGGARLWLRELASLEARPLNGTEHASFPFWSWDGQSIGFFADLLLKRVDLATGQVITLAKAPGGRGGTWGKHGDIVFSPDYSGGLQKVSSMGGQPATLTTVDTTQHSTHRWPQFLPDGSHYLYFAGQHSDVRGPQNSVWVGSVDGKPGRLLMPCLTEAYFADGHLFYVIDSVLVARPFDARSRGFRGAAVPTAERVQFDATTWKMAFSASRAGLMTYQPMGGRQGCQISIFDRSGRRTQKVAELGNHFDVGFSNDGRRVVFASAEEPNGDIFIFELDRAVTRKVLATNDDETAPFLSPDGRSLAYSAQRGNRFSPYLTEVLTLDGLSRPRVLYRTSRDAWPLGWSADGRRVLLGIGDVESVIADSLALVAVDGSVAPRYLTEPGVRFGYSELSPDGRWIAYSTAGVSDPQVFLRRLEDAPAAGSGGGGEELRMQVSTHGGLTPRWRADGRELYFLRPDGGVVVVPLESGTMRPGDENVLFRAIARPLFNSLDVSQDGQRFLINELAADGAAPVVIVSGWRSGVRPR